MNDYCELWDIDTYEDEDNDSMEDDKLAMIILTTIIVPCSPSLFCRSNTSLVYQILQSLQ